MVFIKNNNLIKNRKDFKEREIFACSVHWTRFNIDYDGKSVLCFNELFKGTSPNDSYVLGDVSKVSIESIWKGTRLDQIRESQLKKDYSLLKFTNNIPCVSCNYCQPLDTSRQTSEYQVKQLWDEK